MKCRKHPADPAGGVGVCASCLRERLLAVMAAQAQAQAQLDYRKSHFSQQQQHVPIIPRSVSPYISRRKSDATWQPHVHSTPQPLGPTRQSSGSTSFSSLRSWFSAIIPGRRRKTLWADESAVRRNRDRGMSPARPSDDHCHAGSSGYSSESSQGWRQTPRRTPARRGAAGHCRNVSGLGFCLSPLVRPSPNWNQKGMPPETVASGESRAPARAPHLSSFCKNRSRKLADFGRFTNH